MHVLDFVMAQSLNFPAYDTDADFDDMDFSEDDDSVDSGFHPEEDDQP